MSAPGLFQPRPPDVALQIDSTGVAAVRLPPRANATAAEQVAEKLPPGAVVPSLSAVNIADVAVVSRVVSQVLSRLGGRVSRAALVIPDTAAKVSLIRFEKVPASHADLAELVRWQVRKTAPFPIEQATVTFTPGAVGADGGHEFMVTLARADIVAQYEQACAQAGVHAGLVDIATSSILNGVLAGSTPPTGDWLLVHAAEAYTTLVVMRGRDVIFFRNRERDSEGTLGDVVHQTAMYYEDRLKGAGFSRVFLAGAGAESVDAVRRSLEQRLDVRIDALTQPALAALTGILTRERQAA